MNPTCAWNVQSETNKTRIVLISDEMSQERRCAKCLSYTQHDKLKDVFKKHPSQMNWIYFKTFVLSKLSLWDSWLIALSCVLFWFCYRDWCFDYAPATEVTINCLHAILTNSEIHNSICYQQLFYLSSHLWPSLM